MVKGLLHKNKIFLIDEVTANMDADTERKIHEGLNEILEGCTVLMIAHRLNTILLCDEVVVLESGEVIEFGKVEKLKKDDMSYLGRIIEKQKEFKF